MNVVDIKQGCRALVLPGHGMTRQVTGRRGANGGFQIEIEGAGSVELSPQATIEFATAMLRSQGIELGIGPHPAVP